MIKVVLTHRIHVDMKLPSIAHALKVMKHNILV